MRPALLLVDLQNDFLDRPDLTPSRESLIDAVAALLEGARAAGLPIIHVHTVVAADGHDRMPHWKRRDVRACVRGTDGVQPPAALAPRDGEIVVEKRFFSAFGVPDTDVVLREPGADTVIVASVYLHGCVRATAFDAYERGYEVLVADDAVGSTEPGHAELSRDYLAERAATFLPVDAILARVGDERAGDGRGGRAAHGDRRRVYVHRNPSRLDEVLGEVPIADGADVDLAVTAARRACGTLAALSVDRRAEMLERWATAIGSRRDELAACMAREIGKPLADAREELDRAVAHVRTAVRLFAGDGAHVARLTDDVAVRYRPHGVVGIVTPFNNPVAIPAGKIAPALLFGNAVVLKPGIEAAATMRLALALLAEAGAPDGTVSVVHGDGATARLVVTHPGIDAIAITGSNATGRGVHALCARDAKPLQAELGGNNAAIVLADCDVEAEAAAFARAAYGFAGQRCTAIRRFIVARGVYAPFVAALADASASLPVGEPLASGTVIGPLISARRRQRVIAAIGEAIAGGARLVGGGVNPSGWEHGAWLAPALLADVEPSARVFREETFGPLAIVTPARDLDDALALANAVPHGLVACLASDDAAARRRFATAVEAGIVRVDRRAPFLHAEAPFGGWKASGIGPPEHGVWDRDFYTRPQAVYGRIDVDRVAVGRIDTVRG